MSPLPTLQNWAPTRDSLHRASQVIGAIRTATLNPLPNALRRSLRPTPFGLTTGHSQASLLEAVLGALASAGRHLAPEREHLNDTTPFTLDVALAADYAQTLDRLFTAMARFRARLLGPLTPLVVWPHHFDMAFLWFSTTGADEHQHPHINTGFAPFSPGIDRPYLYMYCWPLPEDLIGTALPPPAIWNTEGWRGVRVDYDQFAALEHADRFIEEILGRLHQTIASRMI
jgi:hypothetical protein